MSNSDPLNNRLDQLEETVTKRLDMLEKVILSKWPDVVLTEAAPVVVERPPLSDQIAIRQSLASITEASADVAETPIVVVAPTPAGTPLYPPSTPPPPAETPQWIKNLTDIEWLTSRIGISLLLIGIITSFFWLNEKTWVTDTMRLTAGYTVGASLLGLGTWLSSRRAEFGQLLAGGGIATFYITTFVGHFYLEVIPSAPTLIIVLAITAVSYGIATWKRQPVFAYIGLIFGLIAPLTLAPSDPAIPSLTTYVCLIVGGAVAVFYTLRWHYLMLTAAAGSWVYMIFLTDLAVNSGYQTAVHLGDQIGVQAGVLFNLAAFGLLSLAIVIQDRRALYPALFATNGTDTNDDAPAYPEIHWTLLAYITTSPIIAAGLSLTLWPDMGAVLWASLMIVAAHLYIGLGIVLGRDGRFAILQLPLYIAGGVLLIFSIARSAHDIAAPLLILFAVEAAALALFAHRQQRQEVMVLPHLLISTALLVWISQILPDTIQDPLLNLNFFASLLLVAAIGTIAWHESDGPIKHIYQFAAHLLILPVTGFELDAAFSGESYWLLLHVVIHTAAFLIGLSRENRALCYQSTLFALSALGLQLIFDTLGQLTWPNLMLLLMVGQLFMISYVATRQKDSLLKLGGLFFALAILPAFFIRLALGEFEIPFINLPALSTLSVILALFVISMWYSDKPFNSYIGFASHILVLSWLVAQSQHFDNVQAVISALWAVYSISLLLVGLLFDLNLMRRLGIGTILLTVGKLFLIDLENVSTGGRVLLFSGFGGVLLVISYFTRNLWRTTELESESHS